MSADRAKRMRDNMQSYRRRLRAQGLRSVQHWVPDTRSAAFLAEARRQSLALRDDPAERDVLDWIVGIADDEAWS